MSAINMDSILAKAQACMNTSKKQAEVNELIDKVLLGQIKLETSGNNHSVTEAAQKFIDVLRNEIDSSGLSSGAIQAICNTDYTKPAKFGNNYLIRVYFTGDLTRPSLQEAKYGNINDIAELFNYGVNHKMNPVQGEWHGKNIWSKTVIPGAHFMESAINTFMANYSSEYNVTNISIER